MKTIGRRKIQRINNIVFIALLLSVSLLAGCQSGICALPDVVYVDVESKEESLTVSSGEILDLGIDGIQYFQTYGPYMVVVSPSGEGFVKVLEKDPPYRLLGSFFRKGNGPGEMPMLCLPEVFGVEEDGDIYAEFDNRYGSLVRFNITQSLSEGRTVSSHVVTTRDRTFVSINLGEDGVFYKEMTESKDAQIRYVERNGTKNIPAPMARLNTAVLANKEDDGFRFNVLSSTVRYHPGLRRFMEASAQLNTIHLYDLDGPFSRTVCIGKKINRYNDIAELPLADRPLTCMDAKGYGDYSAVLYLDVPMSEIAHPSKTPTVLLVSWDGSSVRKIRLPENVTSIDVDLASGKLYTLNSLTETLRVYTLQ